MEDLLKQQYQREERTRLKNKQAERLLHHGLESKRGIRALHEYRIQHVNKQQKELLKELERINAGLPQRRSRTSVSVSKSREPTTVHRDSKWPGPSSRSTKPPHQRTHNHNHHKKADYSPRKPSKPSYDDGDDDDYDDDDDDDDVDSEKDEDFVPDKDVLKAIMRGMLSDWERRASQAVAYSRRQSLATGTQEGMTSTTKANNSSSAVAAADAFDLSSSLYHSNDGGIDRRLAGRKGSYVGHSSCNIDKHKLRTGHTFGRLRPSLPPALATAVAGFEEGRGKSSPSIGSTSNDNYSKHQQQQQKQQEVMKGHRRDNDDNRKNTDHHYGRFDDGKPNHNKGSSYHHRNNNNRDIGGGGGQFDTASNVRGRAGLGDSSNKQNKKTKKKEKNERNRLQGRILVDKNVGSHFLNDLGSGGGGGGSYPEIDRVGYDNKVNTTTTIPNPGGNFSSRSVPGGDNSSYFSGLDYGMPLETPVTARSTVSLPVLEHRNHRNIAMATTPRQAQNRDFPLSPLDSPDVPVNNHFLLQSQSRRSKKHENVFTTRPKLHIYSNGSTTRSSGSSDRAVLPGMANKKLRGRIIIKKNYSSNAEDVLGGQQKMRKSAPGGIVDTSGTSTIMTSTKRRTQLSPILPSGPSDSETDQSAVVSNTDEGPGEAAEDMPTTKRYTRNSQLTDSINHDR